jgi:hypothetical protein
MPNYYIGAPKMERGTWGNTASHEPVEFTVQATIFAQEGSWFVIPPALNPAIPALDPTSATEVDIASAQTTRFRRLNYRVKVSGSIVQNSTPTGMNDFDGTAAVDDVIGSRGAMAQWMDSLSYPTNFGTDVGRNNHRGSDWMTVYYESDRLDPDNAADGAGLYLPVSPDLSYVG